jgi:uridine phosphorylase
MMITIENTHLLINPDGSIYHLNLKPGQVADTIILVGDPDRVPEISANFDRVELTVRNREFVTHTGYYKGQRYTALSTGIGTDNIDIVVNELDALVNIDFATRMILPEHKKLNIIRIGTSGAIQPDIPIDTFGLSTYGIGFDNLLYYYRDAMVQDEKMADAFLEHMKWNIRNVRPYFVKASEALVKKFDGSIVKGMTVTAPGFYGPQSRKLRIELAEPDMISRLQSFRTGEERIINFEMETSALYALGAMLDHNVLTMCALIANRATQDYSLNYKPVIRKLIGQVLDTML